jgi:ATPase inhibitor, mitochondrial
MLMQTSDQFTRREAAQENIYVKEKELEKCDIIHPLTYQRNTLIRSSYRLRHLKQKLTEQRKHLDELDKHMYGTPCYKRGTMTNSCRQ